MSGTITRTFSGREVKRLHELVAHAERIGGPGPHGQLAVLPFRHRCARLHRGVLNVADLVCSLHALLRLRQAFLDRALHRGRSLPACAFR